MVVDLIQNAALLIALSVLYRALTVLRTQKPLLYRILTGVWFGLVAVAGMMMPFVYGEGVIFDGRSVILTLAGLFGGGTVTIIAATIAGLYRIYLGGAGVWAGVATIIFCSFIGLVFRRIFKNKPEKINWYMLFVVGVITHIIMLMCQLLFPWPIGLEIIKRIWIPVMLVFPFTFVLISSLIIFEEKRIKGEKAIRKAEALYRATLYSIGDGVITTNYIGLVQRMNPIAEKLTGWSEKEAIGKPLHLVFNIINEDSREEADSPYVKVMETCSVISLANHTLLISKNGNEIPISDSGAPIVDEAGNITGIVLVFRDQTNERYNRKRLEESEEQFRKLFENHAAVHLLVDPETSNIVNANHAAAQFYGWDVDQLKHMNMSQINTLGKEEILEAMMHAKLKKQSFFEFRHRLANGTIRDVEVFSSPIEIKGKHYLYSIVHDATEKKELFKEIVYAKNRAEESDRLKTAFLANMSHEIRTPLNGILGFTELLTMENNLSVKDREMYSKIINRSADSLMQIIDDILDISKLESGQLSIEKKPIQVNQLIEGLKLIYRQKMNEKNIENIQLNLLLPKQAITIETDEKRLSQIFINLIDNAFKFTSKGTISFGVSEMNNHSVTFVVSDTGIGIPKDMQALIFERFLQLSDGKTKNQGGTGLGLSIVKRLVELLGGVINVESEPGKGATFKFTLPV